MRKIHRELSARLWRASAPPRPSRHQAYVTTCSRRAACLAPHVTWAQIEPFWLVEVVALLKAEGGRYGRCCRVVDWRWLWAVRLLLHRHIVQIVLLMSFPFMLMLTVPHFAAMC